MMSEKRHLPKRNWECRGCEKPKSHQKPHKRAKNLEAQKPRSQEAEKPKSQEAKKPRSQEAKKPKSQEAKKPRSREAEKPRSQEAEKPRSQEAEKPRSQEAEKPRSQEAKKPRSREAKKPRSQEAKKPEAKKNPKKKRKKNPKNVLLLVGGQAGKRFHPRCQNSRSRRRTLGSPLCRQPGDRSRERSGHWTGCTNWEWVTPGPLLWDKRALFFRV